MRDSKKIKLPHMLVKLMIFVVLAIYLIPLAFAGITAFKAPKDYMLQPVTLRFSPTLINFISAWEKADLGNYIFNSLFYTFSITVLSLSMAMLLAFPIARKYIKKSHILLSFLMIEMFLPDGSIPLFQMFLRIGLYNTRLGYIISLVGVGGVPLLFFTTYFQGIPKELDEAAIMDGSGYFNFFFRILLPLSKPAISSMFILVAIGAWNDITKAIIYLTEQKLFPITKGLYVFSGQYATEWTELMAALVIVAAPLIVSYIFLQKYIIDGMTAGSVKM